ncbi:hypothetical protein KAJ27_05440 [bacterium]|nr:hypothetical protein [bacterium]
MYTKLTDIFSSHDLNFLLMKVGDSGISGWKEILLISDLILTRYKSALESSRLVYREITSLPFEKDEIKLAIKVVLMQDTVKNNKISKHTEAYESLFVNLSCFQELSKKELEDLNNLDLSQIISNDIDLLNKTAKDPIANKVSDERVILYNDIRNFEKSLNAMLHGQEKKKD